MSMILAPEPFQSCTAKVISLCDSNAEAIFEHYGLVSEKYIDPRSKIVQNTLSHVKEAMDRSDPNRPGSDISAIIAYLSLYAVNEKMEHSTILATVVAYFFAYNNLRFVGREYDSIGMFLKLTELKRVYKDFVPVDVIGHVMHDYNAFPEVRDLQDKRVWPVVSAEEKKTDTSDYVCYPFEIITYYSNIKSTAEVLDDVLNVVSMASAAALQNDCKQAFIDTWMQLHKQE